MESFYSNMYLDLQDRIKAKVPELVYVEQNFGQYMNEGFNMYPCVLIDFPNTPYSEMQGLGQIGDVTINLMLCFAPFEQSYDFAPVAVKQKAMEYFELEHRLIKGLHGWENGMCQPLIRKNDKSQNQNDMGLRVRSLDFSTQYEYYDAEEEEKTVTFNIIPGMI